MPSMVGARSVPRLVLGLFAAAVMIPAALWAQAAGANIGGIISDDTGAALPGVTVTRVNEANGVTKTVVTDPTGHYRVVELQPAPYQITAELSGFGSVKRTLTLFVGTDATLDLHMSVAGLAETVTV